MDARKNYPGNPFFSLLFAFPPHLLPSLIPFQSLPVYGVFANPLWSTPKTQILHANLEILGYRGALGSVFVTDRLM